MNSIFPPSCAGTESNYTPSDDQLVRFCSVLQVPSLKNMIFFLSLSLSLSIFQESNSEGRRFNLPVEFSDCVDATVAGFMFVFAVVIGIFSCCDDDLIAIDDDD